MKNSVLWGTVAVVVVLGAGTGGGYFYLQHQLQNRLNNGIKVIEQTFPGSSITYDHTDTNIFSRSATLNNVKIKDQSGHLYTMDKLDMMASSHNGLISASIDGFQTQTEKDSVLQEGQIHINHIDLRNFKPDKDILDIENGKIKHIYASKAQFDLLNFNTIIFNSSIGHDQIKIAQYQIKNYGLDRKSDQMVKEFNFTDKSDNGDNYLKFKTFQIDGISIANLFKSLENDKPIDLAVGEPKLTHIEKATLQISPVRYDLDNLQEATHKDAKDNLQRDSSFNGLIIQTQSDPRLYFLKKLGYETLNVMGKLSAQYQFDQGQWNIMPFQLAIKDLGVMKMEMQMKGPEKFSTENDIASILRDYKLVSMKINLSNNGFMDKLLKTTKKDKNESADQVKQNWIASLQPTPGQPYDGIIKQLSQATIDMIHHPDHELRIRLQPNRPYSLADLMNLNEQQLIDHLNMSADTKSKH